MEHTESFQPKRSPEKVVLDELGAIRQETYLMGANDSEIPEINNIIARFKKGECTAEEALTAARAIRDSKQDYH